MKKILVYLFILSSIIWIAPSSYADYQGTIGTRFTVGGEGFGNFKSNIYILNGTKKVSAKIESWSDTSITCLWTNKLSPGTYPLFVQPKGKGLAPISAGNFTIVQPIIDEVTPNDGIAGDTITMNGWYFTNKKPKVYFEDPNTHKRKSCKVISSSMDAQTGSSTLQFVIPKWGLDNYNLMLIPPIGQVTKKFPYYITIIPPTTQSTDNETASNLTSVSDDGIFTFSQSTAQLQSFNTGDVIAVGVTNATPNGALRKVTSVSTTGNQTIVQTTQATLEDAIQGGSLTVTGTLTPAEIKQASTLKGVSLRKRNARDQSLGNIELKIDNVVIYDNDDNLSTTNDQIVLNGSISIEPTFHFDAKIEFWQLKEVSFTQTTPLKFVLDVNSTVTVNIVNKKKEIARYEFEPITVLIGGLLPVYLTPVLSINVGLDGSLSAGVSAGISDQASYTAGLSYDNGQWSPISSFSNSFDFIPPTASVQGTFKGYVGTELALYLYDAIGPSAQIEGYGKLDVTPLENPWWKLYAGLNADLGFEFVVLSHTIASYEKTVIDYEFLIAQANGSLIDNTPPSIPQNFTATAASSNQINLSWSASTDNVGVTGYKIYKGGTYLKSVTGTTTSDTGLSPSINYCYKVSAYDAANNESDQSIQVCVTTSESFTGTISGRVTVGGTGLAGVTVSLTGAASNSKTTDVNGNYTFDGLQNGLYTITPSKTGYSFTPASPQVTISNANATQNFTAALIPPGTYSISGQVTYNGSGLSGVTVSLTGAASNSKTTDVNGNYTFDGLQNGLYTITPSKTGYSFTPVSPQVTINNANATQNFTASLIPPSTYSITGQVTLNGSGLSGVTITLTGTGSASTITNSNGNYTFADAQNGSYTVTPSMTGYTFTPANQAVTINGADATASNFIASAVPGQFSQQGPKLVGTDAVGHALQGFSVSVSADGNTAIVGGSGDNSNAGAAWVWTRSEGVWTQQGPKLVGTDAVGSAYQGWSVAISADGNTAIVGGRDNSNAGAAWVWTRSEGVWTQQGSKLVGSGAVGNNAKPSSVSLSADGNTAIVGGPGDNSNAGAAWVWTRSGGVWTQQGSKLVGSGAVGDFVQQGWSVSLSADGNTAIIGGNGDNSNAGAAWVWTRSGGVWTQQGAKLVGSGAVGSNIQQGWSVAISADGNSAIVGAFADNSDAGAAWVWTRSEGVWTQQGAKLVGSGGGSSQGSSVSLSADGNMAIVGGKASFPSVKVGYVAVWTRSGGVWTQQATETVRTPWSVTTASLCISVSLSGDGNTFIVGWSVDNIDSYAGAAWVFSQQ